MIIDVWYQKNESYTIDHTFRKWYTVARLRLIHTDVKQNKNLFVIYVPLALFLVTGVFAHYAAAFKEPASPAPQGNVPAPINVGTDAQYKQGYLSIGSNSFPTQAALEVSGPSGQTGIYVTGDQFGVEARTGSGIGVSGFSEGNIGVKGQGVLGSGVYGEGAEHGVWGKSTMVNFGSKNIGDTQSAVRGEVQHPRKIEGELGAVTIFDTGDLSKSVGYGLLGTGDVGAAGFINDNSGSLAGYLAYRDPSGAQYGTWGFGQDSGSLIGVGVRGEGGWFGGYLTGDKIGLYASSTLDQDIFKGGDKVSGVVAQSRYEGVYASDDLSDYEGFLAVRDIDSDHNEPISKVNSSADPFYYGSIGKITESIGGNNVGGRSVGVFGDYTALNGNYARGSVGFKNRVSAFGTNNDFYYGGYYDVKVQAPNQTDLISGESISNHSAGIFAKAAGTTDATGVWGEADAFGVQGKSALGVGVYGQGDQLVGVQGVGGLYGTFGVGSSVGAYGQSTSGYGVGGISVDQSGVFGTSTNADGVYGYAEKKNGVTGETAAWVDGSYGVLGKNNRSVSQFSAGALGGSKEGVWGDFQYPSGTGVGVRGSATGDNIGVYGKSRDGVQGDGTRYGVFGNVQDDGGHGIHGLGSVGVYGTGRSYSDTGVYGIGGVGVEGVAAAGTGVGVRGTGSVSGVQGNGGKYGVYGSTTENSGGAGVYGEHENVTGIGVYGRATNLLGVGVYGLGGTSTISDTIGVKGESLSEDGYGVYGVANNVNGASAIYGTTNSTTSWAGKFDGKVAVNGDISISGDVVGTLSLKDGFDSKNDSSVAGDFTVTGDVIAPSNSWGSTNTSSTITVPFNISNSSQATCASGTYARSIIAGYNASGNSMFFELGCAEL